jgi:hypothetical protein
MHAKTTQHPSVCNRPSLPQIHLTRRWCCVKGPGPRPRRRAHTPPALDPSHVSRMRVTHGHLLVALRGMFMCVPVQLLKIPSHDHDTSDRSRGRGFNKRERERERKKKPTRQTALSPCVLPVLASPRPVLSSSIYSVPGLTAFASHNQARSISLSAGRSLLQLHPSLSLRLLALGSS